MTNTTPKSDPVNHPSHYTQYPVEVIELTRHMSFTRGNAVKYVARAGFKGGPEKELEDLKKAKWYLDDDIKQLEKKLAEKNTIDRVFHIPNAKIASFEFEAAPVSGDFASAIDLNEVATSVTISSKAKG